MAETIIGKFKLGEELGRGPLGKVYAAINTETGEEVVFRGFTRPQNADEQHWAQAIERFREELTEAAKLDHPNIAKVLEFGELEGIYYVATENFRGRNLRQILDDKGRLGAEEANALVKQIALALDYATRQGAVHGDLTPYNIMVLADGTVKIINYGLGHIRSKLGSPYVAPEVLRGAPPDLRSDLHALGVLWYAMLVGRVPFKGDEPEALGRAILEYRPPAIAAASPHVQGIIEKLLEKDPEKRYDSGVAVINDLASGIIPAGYERSVVRPIPAAVSWNVQDYHELPSVGDYKLDESDVREIRQRMEVRKDVQQLERAGMMKRLAAVVAALLVAAFLVDGTRLAMHRSRLRAVAAEGGVEILTPLRKTWAPLTAGAWVSSADSLRTGPKGTVTLKAFNGTRVKLGPETQLTVATAGYDAETKSRTVGCDLFAGSVIARVKPAHGDRPPFEVRCRGAVVKVKGTVLGVRTVGGGDTVAVECLRGTTVVAGGQTEVAVDAGKYAELLGGRLHGEVKDLPPEAAELLAKEERLLQDSLGDRIREALTAVEEPVIASPVATIASALGFGKGVSKADSAAIIAAYGAMMGLMNALELSTEYPQKLDLKTLTGLDLGEEGRQRILKQFAGEQLVSYKVLPDGYEIYARAKDSKHSLIRLRNGKVQLVEEKPSGGASAGKTRGQ